MPTESPVSEGGGEQRAGPVHTPGSQPVRAPPVPQHAALEVTLGFQAKQAESGALRGRPHGPGLGYITALSPLSRMDTGMGGCGMCPQEKEKRGLVDSYLVPGTVSNFPSRESGF